MWGNRLNVVTSGLVVVLLSANIVTASADEDQCGVYLAISSTSTVEDTNWGMFAGKDIAAGAEIGSPEIGITIPHLRANSFFADENNDDQTLGLISDFFEEFFWVPDTAAAKFELATGRSIAAIPGAGVLAGYQSKMTNADWNGTSAWFRPQQGEESGVAHPNRGANSPFYNIQVVSTTEIKAGSELFMEFGASWSDQANKDELSKEDYTNIDETVKQMIAFFDKYKDTLDDDSALEIYSFLTKDILKAAIGTVKARRVSAMLPPHPADLHKVIEVGGVLKFSDPTAHRSADWLQKYGLCMDNIRVGASTIPNAGRGAFATRKIAAGGLVAPVPVTHIPHKTALDMHKLTTTADGSYVRESDNVVTQQMMINYCFGHPQSSMVFFPSGSVVSAINHADEPNAKLVWSKHPNHQKMWLQLEPDVLLDEEHLFIGLLFEIVAIRDIAPDEEIFIDYGPEWKAAYQKHVDAWNAKIAAGEINKEWPLRAVDMNAQYHTVKPFKTEAELATEPYPENVALKAFFMLLDSENAGTAADPKVWGEGEEGELSAFHPDNLFDVTILERVKVADSSAAVPYTYKVQWANELGKTTVVEGVPHEAFVFVDKPGTSDQFLDSAFRHFIGIPDEIFPKGPWRNL